jgi:MFS family permease
MFDRDFGIIFWGKLGSVTGVWAHNIVAAIVAFQITGSALTVGMVSAAQFAPQLILTPLSGKLTDRGYGKVQIFAGRFMCCAGSGGLALWMTWAPSDTATPIIVASAVVGIGFVLGGPAMQSIVPALVRPDELPAAMQLNSIPMIFARSVGPALGALTLVYLTAPIAFAMAAATHAVFFLALTAVRFPAAPVQEAGADLSVTAAVRHVIAHRGIWRMLVGTAAVGFAAEPTSTLAPAVAHDLGAGEGLAGLAVTIFGVGAFAGLIVLAALHRRPWLRTQGITGIAAMGVGLLVIAVSGWPPVTLAGFAVLGAGLTIAMTGLSTLIQVCSPNHFRGRIMALWLVAFVGVRPFAAMLDGWLADQFSTASALYVAATVTIAVGWIVRPSRLDVETARRRKRPPLRLNRRAIWR